MWVGNVNIVQEIVENCYISSYFLQDKQPININV